MAKMLDKMPNTVYNNSVINTKYILQVPGDLLEGFVVSVGKVELRVLRSILRNHENSLWLERTPDYCGIALPPMRNPNTALRP
jgi:hypothetical protein